MYNCSGNILSFVDKISVIKPAIWFVVSGDNIPTFLTSQYAEIPVFAPNRMLEFGFKIVRTKSSDFPMHWAIIPLISWCKTSSVDESIVLRFVWSINVGIIEVEWSSKLCQFDVWMFVNLTHWIEWCRSYLNAKPDSNFLPIIIWLWSFWL